MASLKSLSRVLPVPAYVIEGRSRREFFAQLSAVLLESESGAGAGHTFAQLVSHRQNLFLRQLDMQPDQAGQLLWDRVNYLRVNAQRDVKAARRG